MGKGQSRGWERDGGSSREDGSGMLVLVMTLSEDCTWAPREQGSAVAAGNEGCGGGNIPIWRRLMQIQRLAWTASPKRAALVGPEEMHQLGESQLRIASEKEEPQARSEGNAIMRRKQERS